MKKTSLKNFSLSKINGRIPSPSCVYHKSMPFKNSKTSIMTRLNPIRPVMNCSATMRLVSTHPTKAEALTTTNISYDKSHQNRKRIVNKYLLAKSENRNMLEAFGTKLGSIQKIKYPTAIPIKYCSPMGSLRPKLSPSSSSSTSYLFTASLMYSASTMKPATTSFGIYSASRSN